MFVFPEIAAAVHRHPGSVGNNGRCFRVCVGGHRYVKEYVHTVTLRPTDALRIDFQWRLEPSGGAGVLSCVFRRSLKYTQTLTVLQRVACVRV